MNINDASSAEEDIYNMPFIKKDTPEALKRFLLLSTFDADILGKNHVDNSAAIKTFLKTKNSILSQIEKNKQCTNSVKTE